MVFIFIHVIYLSGKLEAKFLADGVAFNLDSLANIVTHNNQLLETAYNLPGAITHAGECCMTQSNLKYDQRWRT